MDSEARDLHSERQRFSRRVLWTNPRSTSPRAQRWTARWTGTRSGVEILLRRRWRPECFAKVSSASEDALPMWQPNMSPLPEWHPQAAVAARGRVERQLPLGLPVLARPGNASG